MRRFLKAGGLTLPGLVAVMLGYGQTIRGTVKDSTGKAVAYATINLKSAVDGMIVAYAASDNNGGFIVRVPEGKTAASRWAVEARCMGYRTEVKNVYDFDTPVDFTLAHAPNELQEVRIVSSRPVLSARGDTLNYNVSDFANLNDRTIGEVIRKLPGITVAADGTISYNNKPISALYIGGDNLLDDKYSIAVNNIPQVAVNRVQVIQNEQPIKVLRNKVVTENVALNLEIKKGAKLHVMGRESVGAGLPANYDANLNGMLFKDRFKAINYLAGNNTGYNVQHELASHNLAEYNQRIDNPLPGNLLSIGAGNTPKLAESRYLFNRAAVLNLNNLINLENSAQLRVNGYYVHDSQSQGYTQQTAVFLPGDTVNYRENQDTRIVPNVSRARFALTINRPRYYLDNALSIDGKKTGSSSDLTTGSSSFSQVLTGRTLNFSNEFNLMSSLPSNQVVQVYSYLSRGDSPDKLSIGPGYHVSMFNADLADKKLVQEVRIPSWYLNNYFAFKIPSGLITQGYKTGFSVQRQTLASELNVVQANNSINRLSDSAVNRLNWAKNKVYAEAAYDLPGAVLKANLTLPVILQQIRYSDRAFSLDRNQARLFVNPHLAMKYQVGKENFLSFNYSYQNQVGTIADVHRGYILTNYRTLDANSAGITGQQVQQVAGGFSYRKALILFFWGVNVSYDRTRSNTIASSVINSAVQQGITLPYPNSTNSWAISGNASKYLFPLRTTFGGAITRQSDRSVRLQNNSLFPVSATSTTLNVTINSGLSKALDVDYKAALMQTGSRSSAAGPASHLDQLEQKVTVNVSPVGTLQFNLSGEHYFTRQHDNPDLKYFFTDAAVKYRVNTWKADLKFSATNFLNIKRYDAVYLSANTLTKSSYTLPGRILMMSVVVEL